MKVKAIVLGALGIACTLSGGSASGWAGPPEPAGVSAEIVWTESDGLRHEIFTSSYRQGSWSDPVMITDDNADNLHPSIDIDSEGTKWVAWTAMDESGIELRYSIYAQQEWQRPKRVPSRLASNIKPSLMIDGQDGVWLVWSGNNGGNDDIYFTRFLDGEWMEEQPVHPVNEVPDILPFLDLDEEQQPVVTWESYRDGSYVKLQSTWVDNRWSGPELVQEQGEQSGQGEDLQQLLTIPAFITDTRQVFLRVFDQTTETSGKK